jgi:C_GCAxxG_C_C family probable redox protein
VFFLAFFVQYIYNKQNIYLMGAFMNRRQKAEDLFNYGYNCAQSVVLCYEDVLGVDKDILVQMSAPFGGGIGRLREVCGAVSGAVMVLGMLTGLDTLIPEEKNQLYALERDFAERFKNRVGSYICRDLVEKHPHGDTHNSKKPACKEIVGTAVEIIEEIRNQSKEK